MNRLLATALIAAATFLALTVARDGSALSTLVIREPGVYEGGVIDAGCAAEHNVVIEADNVTLRNMTLLNANEAAIKVGRYSGLTIDSVVIAGFNCADGEGQYRAGVACWGCSKLTVKDSDISTDRTFGNGIWVKNYGLNTGGGHVFSGNRISGGFDGIGGEPEDQPYGGVYKDTLVYRNIIRACADDGIQVEGGNVNVVVAGNDIAGCALGIALAPTITGPLTIFGNYIHNLRADGYYGAQACFKLGDGGKGLATFRFNLCDSDGDGWKQTNGGMNAIVTRYNCLSVSRYVIELGDAPAEGTLFDWDSLSTTDTTGRFVKWGGTRYGSLTTWRSATGQEPHGFQRECAP